ncbi:MAG: amidohydrolase family protein [Alphaproteobacteria bacterium]|jgi:imidazolonepropionase-like amidohydrolase|nr:amidohydrolase family protein [Alphaproteobacteria bacterium]
METLFVGGLVFDGRNEPTPAMGVLVKGGRVSKVAPAKQFADYQGRRVDTSGGTLMPGLIDCHVHLTLGGEADIASAQAKRNPGQIVMLALRWAQQTLAGGITAVRDCGGKDYLEFAVRDACNSGEQLGPTILAAGRMICMTGGHGNRVGRVADGTDEVVKGVREQIHAGSDFVKIMATGGVMTPGVNPMDAHYSAEEMAVGIAEASRFSKTTASHAMATKGILNAVRGGITSIEHGTFMDDECVEEMLKRGTFLVPTLAPMQGLIAHLDKVPLFVQKKFQMMEEAYAKAMILYYKAGGKIAMGTDTGVPYATHGNNALELAYMADAGMAPLDVLKSSTSLAAELMELSDEGRIAEDSRADFLIVDGNPAEDINMAARRENHRSVWKRGTEVRAADKSEEPVRTLQIGAVPAF